MNTLVQSKSRTASLEVSSSTSGTCSSGLPAIAPMPHSLKSTSCIARTHEPQGFCLLAIELQSHANAITIATGERSTAQQCVHIKYTMSDSLGPCTGPPQFHPHSCLDAVKMSVILHLMIVVGS